MLVETTWLRSLGWDILAETTWLRSLGTQEAPGRHPGGTQEAPRRHPGGTQEASPGLLASRASWRHQMKKIDGRLQPFAKVP